MLAYLRGPDLVSDWITNAAGTDPMAIMFLLVGAFVIIGDFVDAIPAIIIFMPIINKLTEIGGINPVHMGVVIIVTLAFGLITPPYGIALLMASKFVEVRFSVALVRSLPLYLVFFAVIAFCIVFPEIVLWIPKHVLPEIGRLLQSPGRNWLHLSWLTACRASLHLWMPAWVEDRQINSQKIADAFDCDIDRIGAGVRRIGKLALPRQYSGNAVTPRALHCCENSRLVVDQYVMVSRIASLDIIEIMLFVDVNQDTTVNRFEDAGSLYFARLKNNVTIG